MVALTGSGRRVLATSHGVMVSDGDCAWRAVPELRDELVMDLALDEGNPERLIVIVVHLQPLSSRLYESRDGGESFQQLGDPFPDGLLPITLDIAAARPERVYVTARLGTDGGYASVLLTSDDSGVSFTSSPVPGTDAQKLAFIADLSPHDPDRIYLRVSDPEGTPLWTSDDGGASVVQFFRGTGPLLGFAAAPDGSRVVFGGPSDGVWLSDETGENPTRANDLPATCLGWSSSGIYACATSAEGATVERSLDEAASFRVVLRFSELCGDTGCDEGSPVAAACAPVWPSVAERLGATCGVQEPPDFPPPDAGSEPPTAGAGASRAPSCAVRSDAPGSAAPWLLMVPLIARRVRSRRQALRVPRARIGPSSFLVEIDACEAWIDDGVVAAAEGVREYPFGQPRS